VHYPVLCILVRLNNVRRLATPPVKLRELYRHNTARNIHFRGALGLLAGLLVGGAYSAFTGHNEIVRLALPICGVPILLTILNLVFGRSQSILPVEGAKETTTTHP
jgi:uncharacterized membrane protein YfcA